MHNTKHKLRFRRNFTDCSANNTTMSLFVLYVSCFSVFSAGSNGVHQYGDKSIAAPASEVDSRFEKLAKVYPATKLSGYESQVRVTGYSNRTVK